MKWTHTMAGYKCEFAGRTFYIFVGPFRYYLWSYEFSGSYHWTRWGAKRRAIFDMLEHAVSTVDELQNQLDKLEDRLVRS